MQHQKVKKVISTVGYIALGCVVLFCTLMFIKAEAEWMFYPICAGMLLSFLGLTTYFLSGRLVFRSYSRTELAEAFTPFMWGTAFSIGFLLLYAIFVTLYNRG